jgi:hypothetical protein
MRRIHFDCPHLGSTDLGSVAKAPSRQARDAAEQPRGSAIPQTAFNPIASNTPLVRSPISQWAGTARCGAFPAPVCQVECWTGHGRRDQRLGAGKQGLKPLVAGATRMHRVPRKCAGTINQLPSAAFSKSVRRTRRASTRSTHPAVDKVGSSTCSGLWIASPQKMAGTAPSTRTPNCPGV